MRFRIHPAHVSLRTIAFLSTACALWTVDSVRAAEPAVTNRFEAEIRAMARRDATNPPPAEPILFTGSSSIRLWKTLKEDFPGLPVVNNGFGGARMVDLLPAFDRVIAPYKPPVLIVYCGENDLGKGRDPNARSRDPIATADDYVELFRRCRALRPDMKIAVIPMKPSIRRWAHWYEMKLGNARIAEHCAAAGVEVIDIVTPMLGPDGLPRPELFVADKLHMSDAGYRIWTRLVTDWLARQGIRPTPAR
jgi:lysophospholipase L1-like esterase